MYFEGGSEYGSTQHDQSRSGTAPYATERHHPHGDGNPRR